MVEDGAQRVDVGPLVDGAARGLLRRHVLRGAEQRTGLGHVRLDAPRRGLAWQVAVTSASDGRHFGSRLGRPQILGQAPVDHQRLAQRSDQDVGGLEVAMHHPMAVREGHRFGGGQHVR